MFTHEKYLHDLHDTVLKKKKTAIDFMKEHKKLKEHTHTKSNELTENKLWKWRLLFLLLSYPYTNNHTETK